MSYDIVSVVTQSSWLWKCRLCDIDSISLFILICCPCLFFWVSETPCHCCLLIIWLSKKIGTFWVLGSVPTSPVLNKSALILILCALVCKAWLTGCVCVPPSARDADEREKWIHALEGTILRHTLQLRVLNSTLVSICACVSLFVVVL